MIVGFIITLLAVIYGTYSASSNQKALRYSNPQGDELPYRPDLFHMILALASMNMVRRG